MSLVIAAISYAPRNRLHSASISAVLPDPTGPPTPTRRGPWVFFALTFILVLAGQKARSAVFTPKVRPSRSGRTGFCVPYRDRRVKPGDDEFRATSGTAACTASHGAYRRDRRGMPRRRSDR